MWVRNASILLGFLIAIKAMPAETPRWCRAYQKDIDYWQKQFKRVSEEKKQIEKELMELKLEVLEKGVKVPAELKGTEVVTQKERAPAPIHIHYPF